MHDIGHLCAPACTKTMENYGVCQHEKIGADYLASYGFSPKIVELVRSHIDAKRYLVYKYPEYRNKLSDSSKKTLEFQGGAMNEAEARLFEQHVLFKEKLDLRYWDEQGKVVGMTTPELESYRCMILTHLEQSNS